MKIHELKISIDHLICVCDGSKTFELRYNDRGFDVGDVLHLREWSFDRQYGSREALVKVTYVLVVNDFVDIEGHKKSWVVMGIKLLTAYTSGAGVDIEVERRNLKEEAEYKEKLAENLKLVVADEDFR